jgi:putative hydrolase
MATDPDRPADDASDDASDDVSGDLPDETRDRTGAPGSPSGSNPANPLEQLFGSFGVAGAGGAGAFGAGPGAAGLGNIDLSALLGQMQQWLAPHDGAVNWTLAGQVARQVVAQRSDPTPLAGQRSAIEDAVRLSDLWLDGATDLPSGVTVAAAWSRAEWVEQTQPVWASVVEPVAEHVVGAMGEAMPPELKQMAGPLVGLLGQAGGAMFGQQLGQALGGLAAEVLSGTDVGIPLGPTGTAALLPANIAAFGEGLGQQQRDVLLYVALRECAHQRLFTHVPWLRSHLFGAVDAYARGIRLDLAAIEETVRGIDPSNPEAVQAALSDGLFEPQSTPEQQAALDRLETLLALIEGWVDEVVSQATVDRMPSALALREAVRRRRASGGPAEQTFASLVGLELRPRRLRDAATLWGALRDGSGAAARDAIWEHPDLLPSSRDLDDPLGFAHGERTGQDTTAIESADDFDVALQAFLADEPTGGPADESGAAEADPDQSDRDQPDPDQPGPDEPGR